MSMFGFRKKEKAMVANALAMAIDTLDLLDQVTMQLPEETQRELEYKMRVIVAKYCREVDGKKILRTEY